MKEKQREETEKRSSAQLGYFFAGLTILLVAAACDALTRQEPATFKAHYDIVTSVAFSPDGKTLASGSLGSGGNTVKLWLVDARQ